ncbi:MAG TPA: sugar ABC transporter ATP-binding protein [Cyanobacteria bacterium UBA8803]|nr:sugar ABC transporter ATP-binding protein [Cyanobacteria bacterium UBA9273]HBL59310.1 sugar ABC transporter ATP-binding protein [Cyanobacteria bacterium UBA8803]
MKVELQNISKRFGSVLANDEVSLTVEAGTIHGLLGENGAGKSTIVKIISGFVSCDRGQILLNSQPVQLKTPEAAIDAGIGMLHQDPLDFPALSVLENFMLGWGIGNGQTKDNLSHFPFSMLLPKSRAARQLKKLARQFNFTLDIHETLENLSVGERQQLEILRLLSLGVQTLILDEPTTGISATQKEALFGAMKQLAAAGKSIIFVSHKLEDIEVLCDRVTVMRQGKVVGHCDIPQTETEVQSIAPLLVEMMFGRELAQPNKPKTAQADVALQLNHILIKDDRLNLKVQHLNVQCGEVIGLAGLEGSGQQLLLLLCAGLLPATSGTLYINGTNMTPKSYSDYLKAGVGLLPADRLQEGLVRGLSIQEHFILHQPYHHWFINWKDTLASTVQAINLFNIRGQPNTTVERLSGGNQQRTQLALLPIPLNLLLMEHPTRGLDIESSLWVWQQLIARCQTGTAILFTSSDLDEMMQYSDRIIVFSGGNISQPISTTELTVDKLGQMIGGNLN